jgi:hypothetical protein
MNAFQFPLEKVLEWRRKQLELEEVRLRLAIAALAELDRSRAALAAAGTRAEVDVRERRPVQGLDLEALGEFRLNIQKRDREAAGRRTECLQALAAQQAAMLEARRRCRLLERLRDRRLAEWTAARDRELEGLASEAYLARWQRTHPYNEMHDS